MGSVRAKMVFARAKTSETTACSLLAWAAQAGFAAISGSVFTAQQSGRGEFGMSPRPQTLSLAASGGSSVFQRRMVIRLYLHLDIKKGNTNIPERLGEVANKSTQSQVIVSLHVLGFFELSPFLYTNHIPTLDVTLMPKSKDRST